MAETVTGVYERGVIRLLEDPQTIDEGVVRVTIEGPEVERPAGEMMRFGQFAGPGMSTEDDFKLAGWPGDRDIDLDNVQAHGRRTDRP